VAIDNAQTQPQQELRHLLQEEEMLVACLNNQVAGIAVAELRCCYVVMF
jgi:hypothetical protein